MAQPPAGAKEVKVSDLAPQQLVNLKEQLESELEGLQQSALTLQNVATEFHRSGEAIEYLQEQKEGAPLLLPLTQSLYVEGELADSEHVLLDIGTGYYLEKTPPGGVDYCRRKVAAMHDNLQEINKVRQQKVGVLLAVERHLENKMREAQAAAGGSKAAAP